MAVFFFDRGPMMTTEKLWLCPRCHKRIGFALGNDGNLCPNCRSKLRPIDAAQKTATRFAWLRRRWAAFRSRRWHPDESPVPTILIGASVPVCLVALFALWFDSAGWSRWLAVACLVWLPWGAYRLALWRWPVIYYRSWRDLATGGFALYLALVIYFGVAFVYVSTARTVFQVQLTKDLHIAEWSNWFGNPFWFRAIFDDGHVRKRSEGPLAPTGEWHGRWMLEPWIGERWYWHGEAVTERLWRSRDAGGKHPLKE